MAKSKLIRTSYENGVLLFTVGEAGTIEIVVSDLSDVISETARIHGLVQKVSDAAAMPKDELSGDPKKDAVTKLDAMREVAERLTSDEPSWNARAGDGAGPVQGLIYRAFVEWAQSMAKAAKKTVSDEALKARYDAMERKEKLALRNVPAIATIIERLKSERPAKAADAVDTDALLGDLGIA